MEFLPNKSEFIGDYLSFGKRKGERGSKGGGREGGREQGLFKYLADKYSVPLWRDSATSNGFISQLASILGTYYICVDREDPRTHEVSNRNEEKPGTRVHMASLCRSRGQQGVTWCTDC